MNIDALIDVSIDMRENYNYDWKDYKNKKHYLFDYLADKFFK